VLAACAAVVALAWPRSGREADLDGGKKRERKGKNVAGLISFAFRLQRHRQLYYPALHETVQVKNVYTVIDYQTIQLGSSHPLPAEYKLPTHPHPVFIIVPIHFHQHTLPTPISLTSPESTSLFDQPESSNPVSGPSRRASAAFDLQWRPD
jgi:hypothetical protein